MFFIHIVKFTNQFTIEEHPPFPSSKSLAPRHRGSKTKQKWNKSIVFSNTRTSLDMERTLTLIFANSLTTQDIVIKISAFLQLT